ncbi:MAG: SUMF1/EgtB/PvdO family nonheme iron enzyme, partial [Victivallales bacterium]|nr:SUMF1/EgtB/PvdO family nonheme iron enzyme [Victivallales bacterium]
AWGFYDMHGNVSEWCVDKFVPYDSHSVSDPVGRGDNTLQRRVRRGGSWQDAAKDCRCATRVPGSMNFRRPFIGFRVALASVVQL